VELNAVSDEVLRIDGEFDPFDATALADRLRADAHEVVLDFGRAAEVHDLGLVVAARLLSLRGIAAHFRGLSRRQEQMLRFLGFEVAP
jgi:hypothetical protein